MGRRPQEKGSEFNPFIDILTCLAGIMIFIICLVVIEASDAKVLVPTPVLHDSKLEPVYIEVSSKGELFFLRHRELSKKAESKLAELSKDFEGKDHLKLLGAIGMANVGDETYRINLTSGLAGVLSIEPQRDAVGLRVEKDLDDGDATSSWYQKLIIGQELDPDRQMLVFLVRSTDESYAAFKRARSLAWHQEIEVAYEVLDNSESIKFGLGGSIPMSN